MKAKVDYASQSIKLLRRNFSHAEFATSNLKLPMLNKELNYLTSNYSAQLKDLLHMLPIAVTLTTCKMIQLIYTQLTKNVLRMYLFYKTMLLIN